MWRAGPSALLQLFSWLQQPQQAAAGMKSDSLTCPAQLMAYMIAHGAAA